MIQVGSKNSECARSTSIRSCRDWRQRRHQLLRIGAGGDSLEDISETLAWRYLSKSKVVNKHTSFKGIERVFRVRISGNGRDGPAAQLTKMATDCDTIRIFCELPVPTAVGTRAELALKEEARSVGI